MLIKPSASLINDYTTISKLAKSTNVPIYITKNVEIDGVFLSMDAYAPREEALELRSKIIQAEAERVNQCKTIGILEARNKLKERAKNI